MKTEQTYKILLDKKPLTVSAPIITGLQLKQLAGVDAQTYGVWLERPGQEDLLIGNEDSVDLSQPGRERFFTGKNTTTEG